MLTAYNMYNILFENKKLLDYSFNLTLYDRFIDINAVPIFYIFKYIYALSLLMSLIYLYRYGTVLQSNNS